MGDDTIPLPPSPPAEPRRAGPSVLRLLEMALFAGVFVAGGVLAWLAAFGDEKTVEVAAGPELPLPGPLISALPDLPFVEDPGLPVPDVPAFNEQVQFSGARTEVAPPTGGCSTRIDYIWEIDRGLSPPISGQALIEVKGPAVGGDYQRPVQGNEIRLSLDVVISGSSVFEADVVSVGGVPAFPTPLEASFTDAYC
jgi:hypothetical protein